MSGKPPQNQEVGGYMFVNGASWWAYSQGVNWGRADTSAKFRKIGVTGKYPATADATTDPNVYYDSSGWSVDETGDRTKGYFWTSGDGGNYPYLFRPDYQPGVN
jgi:hypothetical protein